jgi:hypothetical protein
VAGGKGGGSSFAEGEVSGGVVGGIVEVIW